MKMTEILKLLSESHKIYLKNSVGTRYLELTICFYNLSETEKLKFSLVSIMPTFTVTRDRCQLKGSKDGIRKNQSSTLRTTFSPITNCAAK